MCGRREKKEEEGFEFKYRLLLFYFIFKRRSRGFQEKRGFISVTDKEENNRIVCNGVRRSSKIKLKQAFLIVVLLIAAVMESEMDLSTDSMEGLDITSDSNIFGADSQRNILELKLKLLSKESEEKYDEVTYGVHTLIRSSIA